MKQLNQNLKLSFIIITILINLLSVPISSKKINKPRSKTGDIFTKQDKSDLDTDKFGESIKYKHESTKIYKLNDQDHIGMLVDEKFYFVFHWETVVEDVDATKIRVDFSKLKGVFTDSHGTSEVGILSHTDPVTPPSGEWIIHWGAPYEAVLESAGDRTVISTQVFGSSYFNINKENNIKTGRHFIYDLNIPNRPVTDVLEYRDFYKTTKNKKYTKSRQKFVTGTNSSNYRYMDLGLSKFVDKNFALQKIEVYHEVLNNNELAVVITRFRKVKSEALLSELLSKIKEYKFPTKLGISACRVRNGSKNWNENNSFGPRVNSALINGVPHNWTNVLGIKTEVTIVENDNNNNIE